jgi:RNA polymerase sigma factor (sigma-70 family)
MNTNLQNKMDLDLLVKEFGLKVSSLARRMIQDKEVAEDASQEVWYEIIKSIDSFKGKSQISTWIYSVAKRTIFRFLKNERVYSENEFKNHFEKNEILFHGNKDRKNEWVKEKCDNCLTAFCHCLDNEARMIFIFREIVVLSYEEISKIMELTEENTRKILSRSKAKIKNFMQDNCILYNPEGICRCRIKKAVKEINLQNEYSKIENTAKLANLFIKFEKELPRKNYWEKFL